MKRIASSCINEQSFMQVSETMSLNNYFNKEYFGPTPMWSCDWPFWVKIPFFDKSDLVGRYLKNLKVSFVQT